MSLHFNKEAIDQIQAYKPLDLSDLGIDAPINKWAPAVKKRLPSIRAKLTHEEGRHQAPSLKILDALEKTLFFKGYLEFFNSLVNRTGKVVLCHNDPQENNILMHTTDNTRLVLIDLEFAGFNPMAYDIGTILNETVCCN